MPKVFVHYYPIMFSKKTSGNTVSEVNKALPFDITTLNDPCIIVTSDGVITDINEPFTTVFKWESSELVGQNIHLLIPSKFIRKAAHDKKMENYQYNKKSPLVGQLRIVPLVNPEDRIEITTMRIVPLKIKKQFCFMAFFNKLEFERRLFDFEKEYEVLSTDLKILSQEEEFRQDSPSTLFIVKSISLLFSQELDTVCSFITENETSPRLTTMVKYFLLENPIGSLGALKGLMTSHFGSTIPYINVICLRIVLPVLIAKVDMATIRIIKETLYEGLTV